MKSVRHAVCRRAGAFSFTELLIATALFVLVVMGVIYTHIFGLRLAALTDSKLSATYNARAALNKVRDEIRSAKIVYVGNGTAYSFNRIPMNTPQIGNSLQIHSTTDTNVFVRYYVDSTEKALMRIESSSAESDRVARYLTNHLLFRAEDHLSNVLTNDQNNRVICMTLEFFRWEYPIVEVGMGHYYDYYRLQTRITRRAID